MVLAINVCVDKSNVLYVLVTNYQIKHTSTDHVTSIDSIELFFFAQCSYNRRVLAGCF